VQAIAIDVENNIWISNWGGGVSKFDGNTWTSYTTADGLADNKVWSITIDHQGNKWFGTNNGVSKLSAEGGNAIEPVITQNRLTLYPNLVQDVLHINLAGKTGRIEVFDGTGRSVLQKQIHENNPSIDVSGLKNGIYVVKIASDNQLVTGKFVKH
jgi:ligand-binding sensor domain-containing protein